MLTALVGQATTVADEPNPDYYTAIVGLCGAFVVAVALLVGRRAPVFFRKTRERNPTARRDYRLVVAGLFIPLVGAAYGLVSLADHDPSPPSELQFVIYVLLVAEIADVLALVYYLGDG